MISQTDAWGACDQETAAQYARSHISNAAWKFAGRVVFLLQLGF